MVEIMKKYSEDYELQEVTDEKGKTREVAVYRGDYFEVSLDEQRVPRFKKLCLILLVMIVFWHLAGGFIGNPGMYKFYVAFPYVAAFFPIIYMAAGILNLPCEKRKFRRDEIGLSFNRIKTMAIIALAILGVSVLGEAVYIAFVAAAPDRILEFLYLSLELMAGAGVFLLFKVRQKVAIMLIKN
jgi:hypothetical protein